MKILFVTGQLPWPLDQGSRIRIFNLIKQISKTHQVYLLSLIRTEADLQGVAMLQPFCKEVLTVLAPRSFIKKCADSIRSIFGALPYTVLAARDSRLKQQIVKCIDQFGIELVQIEELYPAVNILGSKISRPIVFDAHNSEALILKRLALSSKNWLTRWLYREQASKMLNFETQVVKSCSAVLCVSDLEQVLFSALNKRTLLLPNGVEDLVPLSQRRGTKLVFTGTLQYSPNSQGLVWFLENVWPQLESQRFTLDIVARLPSKELLKFCSEHVKFINNADKIEPHLIGADIMIVPLFAGAGTRFKILQAFAYGLPVVSTSVGAEGLGVKHTKELLIADDAQSFAQALIDLSSNMQLRDELAASAQVHLQTHFLWKPMVSKILPMYQELAA